MSTDDELENPFYCPDLPASSYVDAVKERLVARLGPTRTGKPGTLASTFDQALLIDNIGSDFVTHLGLLSEISRLDSLSFWAQDNSSCLASEDDSLTGDLGKRKRSPSHSFSGIRRPSKHSRSLLSAHMSSFDVTLKHEKLDYFGRNVPHSPYQRLHSDRTRLPFAKPIPSVSELTLRVRSLEDELYGPHIGTESPDDIMRLISRLDSLLRGIRLGARLLDIKNPTHQSIANLLAQSGLLNGHVLNLFRTSEIHSLDLTASLGDQGGLNMSGGDTLRVFSAPNSFLFITNLSFAGTPLRDSDLTYIHHLPKLACIILDDTGIGNEALFLLVPLKRTLSNLSLSGNTRIDDVAMPALAMLSKLFILSLFDTRITMGGLRFFARLTDKREFRSLDIPLDCESYLNTLHVKYMVHPVPPLIIDPAMVSKLSLAALQRNLVQHATCNPHIVTTGTKEELAERLYSILITRQMDLVIRDMVWGGEAESDSSSDSGEW